MTTTAQKVNKINEIISEVLRLDEVATAKPWWDDSEEQLYIMAWKSLRNHKKQRLAYLYASDENFVNQKLICNYRTTAPKLAKALQIAIEALNKCAISHAIEKADEALSQINQIFGADDAKKEGK